MALTGAAAAGEDAAGVNLTIEAPGDSELYIAPGRHFKVSGTLSGEIPDDAILRVSLIDSDGNEVRCSQTGEKGTDHISADWYEGPFVVFDEDTPFSEIAYTAPEMVIADLNNPEASCHDAAIKAVYTDDTFAALITCATDVEHGLADPDCYYLTDSEGIPFEAFPEGEYTVRAELSGKDGEELAAAEKSITIGWKSGTVVHEITNMDIISRGGKDRLMEWADEENLTVLNDLLPGMFGPYYQQSTMDMSYAAEKAEYLGSSIHTLLYNINQTSTAYCLEMANFLQRMHTVEDYEIAHYYIFDLGEPSLLEEQAEIRELDYDRKIHIVRIDSVSDQAMDGCFLTTEEQLLSADTNGEDGWTVPADTSFAIMGVIIPYQLNDDEIIDSDDCYGDCTYLNNIAEMEYTIRDISGTEEYTEIKPTGLKRGSEDLENITKASVYEFYNIFSADLIESGHVYEIGMTGYDRNGEKIPGMTYVFSVEAE